MIYAQWDGVGCARARSWIVNLSFRTPLVMLQYERNYGFRCALDDHAGLRSSPNALMRPAFTEKIYYRVRSISGCVGPHFESDRSKKRSFRRLHC